MLRSPPSRRTRAEGQWRCVVQIELSEFSDGRWPWWIAGPALGLLVVGFFLVSNQPLGASGAYAETAKVLAEVKGVSADEMARITTDNFFRVFTKAQRPGATA